jgi:hypothetical protein
MSLSTVTARSLTAANILSFTANQNAKILGEVPSTARDIKGAMADKLCGFSGNFPRLEKIKIGNFITWYQNARRGISHAEYFA